MKIDAAQRSLPDQDERVARAAMVSRLVQDFADLDDDTRRETVEALLGAGAYDNLKSQRDSVRIFFCG